MKKRIVLVLLVFIFTLLKIPLSLGGPFDLYTSDLLDRQRGIPTTGWYEVADWEIEACMDWGGPNKVVTSGVGTLGQELSYIEHNRILTIQAERTELIPSIRTEGLIEQGVIVYEIAWFVQPFEVDEDMNWEVNVIKSNGVEFTVETGNANYYNPGRGYAAWESAENWTYAELEFWNEDDKGNLTVRIV